MMRSCKEACQEAYTTFINEKIINSKNPKKFYSFIKSKKQVSVNVGLLKIGNCYIIDDTKRADILNKQYCSVFSKPTKDTPPINSPPAESVIDDIDVQQNGVLKLLKSVKPHKATGPDGVSARFLKEFSVEIAPALTLLYRNSLKHEVLPQEWLHASIVPVYKGGKDRSSAENYGPVSLTLICCKIMEHIIYSNGMNHLQTNNILSDVQTWF